MIGEKYTIYIDGDRVPYWQRKQTEIWLKFKLIEEIIRRHRETF